MCIVGLVQSPSAKVPLVLVHNRDESLHRPTEGMARREGVLCGKDLRAGGTWLGFHERSGTRLRARLAEEQRPIGPFHRITRQHGPRGA